MCAVVRIGLIGVLAVAASGPALAQSSKSAAAAKQLTAALDAGKLEAIAAKDPDQPDVFVAALYFAGAQLLVVSAQYVAPQAMIEQIAKGNYRDVYLDLSSASVAGTKVFVTDLGANGLVAEPDDDEPFDTFETGGKSVAFNGEWEDQKLTEAEYEKTFATADEQYSRLLAMLLAQAKQ